MAFFGCQAGRNSITAAVNGEISPCSKVLALDNKKLVAKLERRVSFSLSISDRELYVSIGNETLTGTVRRLSLDG